MRKVIPEALSDHDDVFIVERPDGFYWQLKGEDPEYGPFASLFDAMEDIESRNEIGIEPGETVAEAESELGLADWIDEETGEPAEDSTPRLEQH